MVINSWSHIPGGVYCPFSTIGPEDLKSAKMIINTTDSIIKDDIRRIKLITYIKKHIHNCAAFEIGYVTFIIQEKYRMMLDKYNTSATMMTDLHLMEHIMYLEELEHLYWDIDHLYGMIHEIERKYRIKDNRNFVPDYLETTTLDPAEEEATMTTLFMPTARQKQKKLRREEKMRFKWKLDALMTGSTRKRSTRWWWPLEYGWEIDYWWGPPTPTPAY
ncbi:unnamed protein product [Leptosia nina]|uniref:Uncharacterized protein n=1 Tax=Leptosia nina TaxID=320188 RepID=A0AAV1JV96_9NEOP